MQCAAASIRGEVVVKTKPNQSYSPDSPRGSSPILRCNWRGIESSDPPNADYIVVGLLFFIRIQSFLAYFDYFFTTFLSGVLLPLPLLRK